MNVRSLLTQEIPTSSASNSGCFYKLIPDGSWSNWNEKESERIPQRPSSRTKGTTALEGFVADAIGTCYRGLGLRRGDDRARGFRRGGYWNVVTGGLGLGFTKIDSAVTTLGSGLGLRFWKGHQRPWPWFGRRCSNLKRASICLKTVN